MENDEPSISKTRWPNQSPATSVAGTRILTTARRTVWKTANGSRARAWQKALAVKARPASKETWVKAVLPWRTWMRNQWIMAAGVKRQLSHHEWPAWRQAWWMKSQPSLAARSCLRVLRVVEIRRCIAGPPGPWWVRKIPLCTGVPLFSRDEAAWGYRCLNAIHPRSLVPDQAKRTSLHAKCVVVDKQDAFVSSANFTEAGQTRNIEVGVLVRSQSLARKLINHFESLAALSILKPIPLGCAQ